MPLHLLGEPRTETSRSDTQPTREAIEAVYPQTQVQFCMVHLVRHSLQFTYTNCLVPPGFHLRDLRVIAAHSAVLIPAFGCFSESPNIPVAVQELFTP